MGNDDLDRDSIREGLKSKGRARRESQAKKTAAANGTLVRRNDVLPTVQIVYCPIDSLRPHSRKLRKSDPAHIREVANSISALGFNVPLLVGKNNVVIDGDTRLEAARLLGLATAPCIRVDHLNETEQRLLRLAVNRLGEKGSWDIGELEAEFKELIIADAPIELSGFGSDEIDQIVIGDAANDLEVGPLEPDPDAQAVARIGDVFQLGDHRIICGDSTDPDVYARLMDGDKFCRLILTDEPYNVKIQNNVTRGQHREFKMASGEMSNPEFLEFNVSWILAAANHLVDGGVFGTFIDWRGYPTVHAAATQTGLSPLNLVVWTKTNAGMGSLYRSQHELLPLFKKGDAPHINNIVLGKRGRWRSNVWTYPGASSLGSDARRGLKEHPTVKPTAMLEDALVDLTNRGEKSSTHSLARAQP